MTGVVHFQINCKLVFKLFGPLNVKIYGYVFFSAKGFFYLFLCAIKFSLRQY